MCFTCLSIIVRASYRHVRMNAILFIYILHVSLSLFLFSPIEILYIYSIYFSQFFILSLLQQARERLFLYPFFFLFRLNRNRASNTYAYLTARYPITMHLPLEAPYYKITNKRKREFLSTLGRMQALLVSCTAYGSVTASRRECTWHQSPLDRT